LKSTLEFKLPDEEKEFLIASRAGLMSYALHCIDSDLRNFLKYQESHNFKTAEELAKYLREEYTIPTLNQLSPDV
jgi:hypothetical protein